MAREQLLAGGASSSAIRGGGPGGRLHPIIATSCPAVARDCSPRKGTSSPPCWPPATVRSWPHRGPALAHHPRPSLGDHACRSAGSRSLRVWSCTSVAATRRRHHHSTAGSHHLRRAHPPRPRDPLRPPRAAARPRGSRVPARRAPGGHRAHAAPRAPRQRQPARRARRPRARATGRPRAGSSAASAPLLIRHGIELPQRNAPVGPWTVDCLWPDRRVVVELDGAPARPPAPGRRRPPTATSGYAPAATPSAATATARSPSGPMPSSPTSLRPWVTRGGSAAQAVVGLGEAADAGVDLLRRYARVGQAQRVPPPSSRKSEPLTNVTPRSPAAAKSPSTSVPSGSSTHMK